MGYLGNKKFHATRLMLFIIGTEEDKFSTVKRQETYRGVWELIKMDQVKLLIGIKGWNNKGVKFSGEIFNQDVYYHEL